MGELRGTGETGIVPVRAGWPVRAKQGTELWGRLWVGETKADGTRSLGSGPPSPRQDPGCGGRALGEACLGLGGGHTGGLCRCRMVLGEANGHFGQQHANFAENVSIAVGRLLRE